jgi:hypothetical protein
VADDFEVDPRLPAAVELIGRTGSEGFQLRYCDEEKPVVWLALAEYGDHWEVAAAMAPGTAIFRLCEQLVDGGKCTHCGRPTGVTFDFDPMPVPESVCWYQWDPELATFRRGCE